MTTSCEFEFGFWDVTARDDAIFSAPGNRHFADLESINTEDGATMPELSTLEHNAWTLNGSKTLMPEDTTDYSWGWWSEEISGADGAFINPPVLITTFTENHSSAGITLRFFSTLPKTVNIKWYSLTGQLLADEDFNPDSVDYFCDYQVENYGKVVITVLSMNLPYRYFRCTKILFGVLEILDTSRITKAVLCEEISPVGLTLPIKTLKLSFFTNGGRFQLLDPSGAYRLFQWKQQMKASDTINGECQPMGVFFLQEMTGQVDSLVDLELVDIIGVLDTINFAGGIYDATPVRTLIDSVLDEEDIEYDLDPSLENKTITGYLPICTKRIALKQIAFAIGSVVDTSRQGMLRFRPIPSTVSHTVSVARKIIGHTVKLEELVTRVDLTIHAYRLSEETKELINTTLSVGRHRLIFNAPASVQEVAGGILVDSHPNFAVVDVSVAGEVTLIGNEYVDDTSVYTVQTDELPSGAKPSTKSIKDATLIDAEKAPEVAQRLYNYYQLRYTDDGKLLPGNEQIGQIIELQSIGGKTITGPIQRLTIDMAGGCLTKLTMRGA